MTYLIFFLMAAATISSPGPGVIFTLSNTLRLGFVGSVPGFLGLATGAVIVAGVSATGMGIIISTSDIAFNVMKFIGAVYLVYLGIKLWRVPHVHYELRSDENEISGEPPRSNFTKTFSQGFILQYSNPKAVFFFMSIFPQFINAETSYMQQFTMLVFTYSGLLIVIHGIYALLAQQARGWLSSPRGGTIVNKASGLTFVSFGLLLANANR